MQNEGSLITEKLKSQTPLTPKKNDLQKIEVQYQTPLTPKNEK